MKLNVVKNKKGSALLWVVLMTIIITILLGAVLAATYAYFSYTTYTVKRQQAYFTARSAINACLEEFTSVEQSRDNGSYQEGTIALMPDQGGEIEVTDFGFVDSANMGDASAKITRSMDDEIKIKVTATYADQTYKMNATVSLQPLYFGGIAVKQLSGSGKLTLDAGTDFYWNNSEKFNIPASRLELNGNFVSKGDATIPNGMKVAGHTFTGNHTFNNANGPRKIWNANEYIISNKTLTVADDENTEYVSTTLNTLSRLTDTHAKYCNNTYYKNKSTKELTNWGTKLGNSTLGEAYSSIIKLIGLGNLKNDIDNSNFSFTYSGNDATSIQYIEILSANNVIQNALDDAIDNARFGKSILKLAKAAYQTINQNPLDTMDISYIDYSSTDANSRRDHIIPLTYIFLRGGKTQDASVKMRVKYGSDPGKTSRIGKTVDNIKTNVTDFIDDFFDINKDTSYTVIYLEKNTILHLGYQAGSTDPANLVFLYSIYGGENTTVYLHNGVKVVGEIICDNLVIDGDVDIVYASKNGSQVAKQRIAEYWTVSNYSDKEV